MRFKNGFFSLALAVLAGCTAPRREGAPVSSVQTLATAEAARSPNLRPEERALLARLDASSTELGAERGGDLHLTNRDLKIILIVAGAVLLLALIL